MTPESEVPLDLLALFVFLIIATAVILTFVGCGDSEKPPAKTPPENPTEPEKPTKPRPIPAIVNELLDLHNFARTQNSVPKLHLHDQLLRAAQKHAEWMAQNEKLSHTGENGSSVGERVLGAGYKWRAVGENIALGFRTPQQVVAGWLNSPGHRRNILSAVYQDVGFGYARSESGRSYWSAVMSRHSERINVVINRESTPPGLVKPDPTEPKSQGERQ